MEHPHAIHLKILAVVNLIFGGLGLLVAVGCGLFFALGAGLVASQSSRDPEAAAAAGVLGIVGVIFVVIVGAMSLPQLLGGWGLLRGKNWGRILILILSALSILNVPIGTALGIYGFWALLHNDADAALATLNPDTRLYS